MQLSELRFPSKYLVEVKSFFSTTQFTLLLQQNELKKFSMEKDNKQAQVETFSWQMILDVQVSERAPTEFTIDLLPVLNQNMRLKERDKLIQSGSKANTCTQMTLHCAERDKLVAELKHIVHIKNLGGKPKTQHTCWYQSEICEDSQQRQPRVFSRFNVGAGADDDNSGQSKQGQQQQSNSTNGVSKSAVTGQVCKAKIYPTAIHMLVDRQGRKIRSNKEPVGGSNANRQQTHGEILPSQNAMGDLLVSAIPNNFDAMDTEHMMESRMIMGGSDQDDEDEAAARSLFKTGSASANTLGGRDFLASRQFQIQTQNNALSDFGVNVEDMRAEQELDMYNNEIEQVRGGQFINFDDDRQDDGNAGVGDGAIGILGTGAQITTFGGANFARNRGQKLEDRYSQHAIYLNELIQVVCQEGRIVSLVKMNQEIEQVIFKDNDSQNDFIQQLLSSYEELMKRPLHILRLRSNESLRSKIDFLNWPGCDPSTQDYDKSCFKIDVELVLSPKVTLIDYSVQLDQVNVYLVNNASKRPVKQMPLVCLQTLRIVDDDPLVNLILTFAKDVNMSIKAKSHYERERLVSCILTMRALAMSDQRGISTLDSLKVLHNRQLDFSHKIQAYSPIEDDLLDNFSQSLTLDYELGLIRKLSELMSSEVQTMQLDNVIDEILLNATFCYVSKVPEQFVRVIMADFQRCFANYLEYEEQKAELIDVLMDKATLTMQAEGRVNFLSQLHHARSNSHSNANDQMSLLKEESLLFKNERHQENLKALDESFEQTVRYLNVLKILLNSRVFMQEMANQEIILQHLTLLLISKSSVIAQLSAQVIRASCHHFSGSESKIERVNKRALIRGTSSNDAFTQTRQSLHSSLSHLSSGINKNRAKRGYFFEAIFEFIKYLGGIFEGKNTIMSLHLTSINLILSSVLQERQQSTSKEDLAVFAEMVNSSDYVTDERASNKSIFQLIDKFCLLDAEFFDIQYMFTMMLSQCLDHYFDQEDWPCLRDIQSYIITYSIQFVQHFYLQMTSKISHQRTLSIKLLARLLHSYQESHDLLLRILPQTLFHKVKPNRQGIESLQWNFPQWVEFFTQIVPRNFNSATEQWNHQTRNELELKLLQAKRCFLEIKQLNQATISNQDERELMLPIHEFSTGKLVMSRWKNLKWNYKEFRVNYDCLDSEYLVGKYFLTKLLLLQSPSMMAHQNNGQDAGEQPQLSMQIQEPASFWNELLMQFMASMDPKEQKMIIMTMCVVYRQNFEQVMDMKTIPYWLKLIQHPEFTHVHFLLLQLLHVSLTVRSDIAKANVQLLIKAKGFHVLHNCMNHVFKDLQPMNQELQVVQESPQNYGQWPLSDQLQMQAFEGQSHSRDSQQMETYWNQINFTSSGQLTRYFKTSSMNVCKGILALRIIDQVFILKQFQYHLPMPTNVEYMLQKHALATLAQSFMLQSVHLTREVLRFIESHLNNHYALYKLKCSGLIEFLIVAMNTRNSDRALSLLLKIQEVCISFNEGLDFSLFNIHDLQMIRDNKDSVFKEAQAHEREFQFLDDSDGILNELEGGLDPDPLESDPSVPLFDSVYYSHKQQAKPLPPVLESIFLRYLPTPFVKFLYERGKNEFLHVYRSESYRHPILVWNKEQRLILEQTITTKAQSFMTELTDFAMDPEKSVLPEEIPLYEDKVENVIKYKDIEDEVRSGRYYLSVWIQQAKIDPQCLYIIPQGEEQDFHTMIKAELKHCIEVDQLRDKTKIITLLKSELLALKKFKLKRIQALSEIKTILVHTASEKGFEGGSKLEQKLIILTAMRVISKAIHQDQKNREEVLSMDGIRTISSIITHILSSTRDPQLSKNAGDEIPVLESPTKDNDQSQEQEAQIPEQKQKLQFGETNAIDRIDAKTLNLCVESINILFNEDTRAFMEFPLDQRINIFRQMSQMLDISFQLYPMLEHRKLKLFTNAATTNLEDDGEMSLQSQNQNFRLEKMISNPSTSQITITSQVIEPNTTAKPRGGKSPDYDYETKSLMSIIQESKNKSDENRPDPYSVCLIFNITSTIFALTKSVAIYPLAHPELIASGLFWRAIQHCFFDLTEKLYRRSAILKAILKDCTLSLKLMVTFVDKFMKCRPEEQQHFLTLSTNQTENEIMKNFNECIKRLFTTKILEKLFIQFLITRDLKLEYQDSATSNQEFLKLFSSQQLQSPELVWNDETRAEMQSKLKQQIQYMEGPNQSPFEEMFCKEIKDFEYSVNRTELRIQGIFVKYFNEQCLSGTLGTISKAKLSKFADQIIDQLVEFSEDPQQHEKNVLELVEAFKNLMISLNLVIKSEEDFERYFETLCNLVKLSHSQEQEGKGKLDKQMITSENERKRVFDLSSHILEIVRTILQRRLNVPQIVYQQPQQIMAQQRNSARMSYRSSASMSGHQSGAVPVMIDSNGQLLTQAEQAEQMCHISHCTYLLKCQPFFRLLVKIMYQSEIQAVAFKQDVIPMLHELISLPEFVMHLFIDRGLIMFLLNLIFDKETYESVISKEMRGTLTDQVLKIDRVMQGMERGNLLAFSDRQSYGVVKAFIPTSFFAEINEQMWRMRSKNQSELVQLQMQFLDNFDADYFENALIKWDKNLREESQARVTELCEQILNGYPIPDLRSFEQIVNMELEKEERIIEVILRNYNHNPAVFINSKLNMFITDVATQLFTVSQHLYAMRQDDSEGHLTLEKIKKLTETPEKANEMQRKYKYLLYQAQLQLTSLLLSIEQLLYNEYNPNLLQTRQDEKLDAQARLTAQLIQRTTDIRQVEEKVFKFFNMWLQYPVFLDNEMPEDIRITFLQALFLVIDIPTSMQYFKKTEIPLEFISKMIARIVKEQGQEARIIEDSLILLVAQRMLRVDLHYTCPQLAIKDTLDQLVKIAITKRPLQRYIKQILYLISQNTHYSTNVIEVLERNNGNRQDLDRLRAQSNADFFNQVWRAKPTSSQIARNYYEWQENQTIQRTKYREQLDKLPILSPESVSKLDESFLPSDLKEYIETAHNNSQMRMSQISRLSTSFRASQPTMQSNAQKENKIIDVEETNAEEAEEESKAEPQRQSPEQEVEKNVEEAELEQDDDEGQEEEGLDHEEEKIGLEENKEGPSQEELNSYM